jgi:hypothetical protein
LYDIDFRKKTTKKIRVSPRILQEGEKRGELAMKCIHNQDRYSDGKTERKFIKNSFGSFAWVVGKTITKLVDREDIFYLLRYQNEISMDGKMFKGPWDLIEGTRDGQSDNSVFIVASTMDFELNFERG